MQGDLWTYWKWNSGRNGYRKRNICSGYYLWKSLGKCRCSGSRITNINWFLINFARPFIYSTAPSPQHVLGLSTTLDFLKTQNGLREKLKENIDFFIQKTKSSDWGASKSAIQTFFIPGIKPSKESIRDARSRICCQSNRLPDSSQRRRKNTHHFEQLD